MKTHGSLGYHRPCLHYSSVCTEMNQEENILKVIYLIVLHC